ncbi:glycosyl hydrolase-related protein [Streptomyces sp. NBC_00057]|uniref:glycosyl hydrolase-related protein n=1 Tax=Streptomyces sp. NBC_00057 TaxID=2975634 RepID=UPI003864F329
MSPYRVLLVNVGNITRAVHMPAFLELPSELRSGRRRVPARLTAGFALTGASVTDLLERPLAEESAEVAGDSVRLRLRPFQIVTLRLTPLEDA